ncbi:MAG: hypothetical protein JOY66_13460, partial [Acetobacteraceae bacterium]|nr:hypothetical protein [Acetobacteraceae bacterium]
ELAEALCARMIEGVAAEAGSRSVRDLAAERDALLVEIMEVIARRRGA